MVTLCSSDTQAFYILLSIILIYDFYIKFEITILSRASLMAETVKNLPAMRETLVGSLGWEVPLEQGKAYPLQFSGLENFVDCIVHGVSMSRTRLIDFHFWDRSSITLLSHHSPYSLVLLNTCWYFQGTPPEASAPHLLNSFKNLSFSSVVNHFP